MFVTNGGGYGGRESLLFELLAGRGSAYPATAPRCSMCGYGRRLGRWTTGKQASNPRGHLSDQCAVLLLAPGGANSPGCCSFIGVQRALLFCFLQCGVLRQNALSLITPTRPAETYHYGCALAILGCPP